MTSYLEQQQNWLREGHVRLLKVQREVGFSPTGELLFQLRRELCRLGKKMPVLALQKTQYPTAVRFSALRHELLDALPECVVPIDRDRSTKTTTLRADLWPALRKELNAARAGWEDASDPGAMALAGMAETLLLLLSRATQAAEREDIDTGSGSG